MNSSQNANTGSESSSPFEAVNAVNAAFEAAVAPPPPKAHGVPPEVDNPQVNQTLPIAWNRDNDPWAAAARLPWGAQGQTMPRMPPPSTPPVMSAAASAYRPPSLPPPKRDADGSSPSTPVQQAPMGYQPYPPQVMAEMMRFHQQMAGMMAQYNGQQVPPPPMPYQPQYGQQQIPTEKFAKLVGSLPVDSSASNWDRWYDGNRGDKDPVPKWDGKNPARTLKPWLRELRLWRHETSIPANKHGLKLYRSFEQGSWMKQLAEKIPEEELLTANAWELILREILVTMKPYLDVELDVLIEETLYAVTKDNKETMTSYVSRKMNKKREMQQALGMESVCCKDCNATRTVPRDIPDEIWSYIMRRHANMSEEQRKLVHQWDSGTLSSARVVELLLRLDRTDTIVAQSVVSGSSHKPFSGFQDESEPVPYEPPGPDTVFGVPEEETVEDDSEDDFDQNLYDDDGLPLANAEGETLIPFEPERVYEEEEAIYLCSFAGTYREVRGQLQATRVGREQKVFNKVKKGHLKGDGKGQRNRPFFKPGQKPRATFPDKRTVFKDKVGGKVSRGPPKEMMKRVKCFRCGKQGHMSRDCKSGAVSSGSKPPHDTPSRSFFQFQSSPVSELFSAFSATNHLTTVASNTQVTLAETECEKVVHVKKDKDRFSISTFYAMFFGLMTSPCHGLIDTGAQDGTIGLWHFQRWVCCLALEFGLQPVFLPMPERCEAGGIGGQAKVVGLCDMPTGIAGINGITRWAILDEPDDSQKVPPLLPNKLFKALDAVIEPKHSRMTLRDYNAAAYVEELSSEHHTTPLVAFDDHGWELPEDVLAEYGDENPFRWHPKSNASAHQAQDERLRVEFIVDKAETYVSKPDLQKLRQCQGRVQAIPIESYMSYVVATPIDASKESPSMSKCVVANETSWPKDTWKKGPGCWIRVHNKPRKAMFIPTGTKDGPPVSELLGSRSTKVQYVDSESREVINDEWLTGAQRCLPTRWTGCTIFQTRVVSPSNEDSSSEKPSSRYSNLGPYVGKMFDVLFSGAQDEQPPDDKPDTTSPRRKGKPVEVAKVEDEFHDCEDHIQATLDYRTKIALHPELLECASYVEENSSTYEATSAPQVSSVESSFDSGSHELRSEVDGVCSQEEQGGCSGGGSNAAEANGVGAGCRGLLHQPTSVGTALEEVCVDPSFDSSSCLDRRDTSVIGESSIQEDSGGAGGIPETCRKSASVVFQGSDDDQEGEHSSLAQGCSADEVNHVGLEDRSQCVQSPSIPAGTQGRSRFNPLDHVLRMWCSVGKVVRGAVADEGRTERRESEDEGRVCGGGVHHDSEGASNSRPSDVGCVQLVSQPGLDSGPGIAADAVAG